MAFKNRKYYCLHIKSKHLLMLLIWRGWPSAHRRRQIMTARRHGRRQDKIIRQALHAARIISKVGEVCGYIGDCGGVVPPIVIANSAAILFWPLASAQGRVGLLKLVGRSEASHVIPKNKKNFNFRVVIFCSTHEQEFWPFDLNSSIWNILFSIIRKPWFILVLWIICLHYVFLTQIWFGEYNQWFKG